MWKGSGRSLRTTLLLENFKFTLFVITPVITAGIYCSDTAVERIVTWMHYVTYPAEGERPPTNNDEVRERLAHLKASRKAGD
eukprot:CAMPEP_0183333454 /NCGR_PEP_ID=MMETSP0164_2-20130417/2345_1 /TAXON_ID=221442 /ORGANISM="Coccolithus pelagicus ssp braarudi, Strain PLY182g" /LENGTH=81 /DNA_ID=CAMNT_0025502375 /DNA_START=199 /DNA_END=447 /DNA_ORIENTATION=-